MAHVKKRSIMTLTRKREKKTQCCQIFFLFFSFFVCNYLYVLIYFDIFFYLFIYIYENMITEIPTEAKLSTLVEFPPSFVPTWILRLLLQDHHDDACLRDGERAAMIYFYFFHYVFPLLFFCCQCEANIQLPFTHVIDQFESYCENWFWAMTYYDGADLTLRILTCDL